MSASHNLLPHTTNHLLHKPLIVIVIVWLVHSSKESPSVVALALCTIYASIVPIADELFVNRKVTSDATTVD